MNIQKIKMSEEMSIKHMLARMSNDPNIQANHIKELIDAMSHEELKVFSKNIIEIILNWNK